MREGVGSDVGMAEVLGEKRSVGYKTNQTKLPKKEGFLRMVQQKIRYWRRLYTNPARSNESIIMELLWAWEPTYRK